MAKVSPIQTAFSSGEWSPLMAGRVDNDHYGASLRQAYNSVPVAQGPIIRRSGTKMVSPVLNHAKKSRLIPFENSIEDAFMLGFSDFRMRVMDESGPLLRASTAVSAVVTSGGNAKLTSAGHGANVGDYVYCSGFAATSPLNGAIVRVAAVAGDDITLDTVTGYTTAPTLTGSERVARTYMMVTPYSEAALQTLRTVQSADVLYCLQGSVSPTAISRYDTFDWRSAALECRDGPYMGVNTTDTTLTPGATGDAIPDTIVSGDAAASTSQTGHGPELAFGINSNDYWDSGTTQAGWVSYDFGTPKVIIGYTIFLARAQPNDGTTYKDYAPLTFSFEGWDGTNWIILDRQADYVSYEGGRSNYFELNNTTAYQKYRLNVDMIQKSGDSGIHIGRIAMKEAISSAPVITFTASSTTGINKDDGFQSTDVGRVLRFRGTDGRWRWYRITAVTSTTVVECQAQGDPLHNKSPVTDWRLGLWSNTTGWPTCAHFYGDRMWLGGSFSAPDTVVGTKTGGYSPSFLEFAPTAADGTIAPDNGIVAVLTARKVGAIRWITSDYRGLIIGTLNGNWVLRPADLTSPMGASNIEARPTSARASADIEAVNVDEQVLYVQRGGRAIRELAYSSDVDGYKAPSMSLYSTHMGRSAFTRTAFAAEPHSILWVQREDGSFAGFTYNREEGVLGWHGHGLGGEDVVIEDVATLPSMNGPTDATWFIVRRTIGGQTRRYYEVLQPFNGDGDTFEDDAFFFDCGLAYEGDPTSTVYGAWHLEGQTVGVLADGSPVPPVVVTNGTVSVPFEASRIVFGLMYDSFFETVRPNAGSSDGTAQGKMKRAHSMTVRLWQSGGGQYGRLNLETGEVDYEDFVHATPDDITDQAIPPFTGDYGPFEWPGGYDKDSTFFFRQPGHIGLPFNVVAIMPQLVTQDRG